MTMMTKLLVVVLLAVVPAAALLAEAPADTETFNGDIETEYMWCCSDARCWDACQVLCDHGKPDFCPGGANHFASGGNTDGHIRDVVDDRLGLPTTNDNPFGRQRSLEIITGCIDQPANRSSPEWQDWFTCYEEFFLGNKFARAHCVNVLPALDTCCAQAICGGDPHFKSWAGEWYYYHGECDLNFIHAPSFAHGMGLDVHIRTKIRGGYSFIESAAIKIGADVFELSGWGQYLLNGVANADLEEAMLGAFQVTYAMDDKVTHSFLIDAGDHKIIAKTFKDFVSITLDDGQVPDYWDSSGMMGQYGTGLLYGRNATTVYTKENINDFGQEWQVRPDELSLFENTERAPQYPAKCLLPDQAVVEDKRRLVEKSISREDAREACAGWRVSQREKCVYDVMATGDLELAAAGGY